MRQPLADAVSARRCVRTDWLRVDTGTGEVLGRIPRCDSWQCGPCAQRRSVDLAEHLRLGILVAQERGDVVTFVTLTSGRWMTAKQARKAFRRWRRRIEYRIPVSGWAMVLHAGQRGLLHAHVLLSSAEPIGHRIVREHAVAAGWGPITDARTVGNSQEDAGRLGRYLAQPLARAGAGINSGGRQYRPASTTCWGVNR